MRRMKPLRAVFPLVLLCLLAVTTAPSQAQDVAGDLLGRINGLRASLGLAPYTLNGALNAAAQDHAQWMATALSISHTRPDGSTPTSRAAAAGYPSSFVSENIYGGTGAGVNDAWTFWVNSPIHYRGMTNAGYTEIGIGYAVGAYRTYVLVFGSQSSPYIPSAGGGGGGGNSGGGRPSAPPSFVVGVDNYGNIMHEIQPGHDLGQIALIYGYTWDDIPYMLELNNMTSDNIRLLPVGGIFLVPPWDGTYTPTPLPPGVTLTATPDAPVGTPIEDLGILNVEGIPTISLLEQFNQTSTAMAEGTLAAGGGGTTTPTAQINAVVPQRIVTSAELPVALAGASSTPEATLVAMVNNADTNSRVVIVRESQTSPWLMIAIVVQTLVIAGAAFEFGRRMRRK
jgi:hypothetical protein